jgi:hypothetical protein
MRDDGMEDAEGMSLSRVVGAMPILIRAFRPVLRAIAWTLFLLLTICWVFEAVHSVMNYTEGGWPAVIGYVQHIGQGHSDVPVSWTAVLGIHIAVLIVTVGLAWYLRTSSRGTWGKNTHAGAHSGKRYVP